MTNQPDDELREAMAYFSDRPDCTKYVTLNHHITVLLRAVREQAKRIEEIEAKNAALKAALGEAVKVIEKMLYLHERGGKMSSYRLQSGALIASSVEALVDRPRGKNETTSEALNRYVCFEANQALARIKPLAQEE